MWIKIIAPDKTDFYSNTIKFEPGQISSISDKEWNPEPICGGGIHFSQSLNSVLENTQHKGSGYLIEVEPIGPIVIIDDKAKAKSIKVVRFLTIPEWLEELKADDSDWLNRLLRVAKLGLEELKADDSNELNRLLRAAKLGLEELKADDSNELNRLLRAAKLGKWDKIFKVLK